MERLWVNISKDKSRDRRRRMFMPKKLSTPDTSFGHLRLLVQTLWR